MVNKKKRNRVQATNAIDAKEVTGPLQSEQKPKKKKFKFLKTLTNDATPKPIPANDAQVQERNAQKTETLIADESALYETKKKKKKKKKKKSPGASIAPDNVIVAIDKKKTEGSEIDDLFASLKTTKQKKNIEEEQQKLAEEDEERREKKENEQLQQQIKKLEAKNTNSSAAGLNPDPRPVRYDEDGLPIYTEASLQINRGGNTKDCPFDCWCCF
ncbi:hypothetical protein KXD40_006386 [Peronospora effusa]|uniref:DUF1764 domain-containing protein n=1 Tax=Peronospora effusa TaxID=542832 RepID=A0A3M6VH65_9STRA|nr:hypothetical protein DD238_001674 [Peronospora effusa]RQM17002.1 hypothetical protein DD237_001497 [Peronospora effusa]UIZ25882.1 hypothetical protein KXD40_006386 [Peronospora effusa]